ncbi:type II toxin-antitoxin system PemK/MazF family toxin [Rothia sp. ZJ932]|uniref:type II toxin-antitoxin system PemK/MazF family toxin n=1 Tax=Rothia sp. ZJ932 TaxID=2810516 RepID=UPI001966E516|nr:type II toxin-antitoxin system PemK/MazF family toxin [Rothia sp. ZJ932]QRZ60715.1 type II toxin-antitoxin system PemK/MazF family toxin [Rothia sp. ZJ932]
MKFNIRTLLSLGQRAYREYQKIQRKSQGSSFGTDSSPANSGASRPSRQQHSTPIPRSDSSIYPGDFRGRIRPQYSPAPNGSPDPGEVVWTWVPYEDDYNQGKDRPVLLIGKDGEYLLALMLTSKDNTNVYNRDPNYLDIGSGPWDKKGRPSEIKLNRIIRVREDAVRREGAIMPESTFNTVINALNNLA